MEVAYILIKCDLGAEVEIIEELSKIEQIKKSEELMEFMIYFVELRQIQRMF